MGWAWLQWWQGLDPQRIQLCLAHNLLTQESCLCWLWVSAGAVLGGAFTPNKEGHCEFN